MTLADDVDLEVFIMAKDELSGADIKAICTESGLLALRERRMKVCELLCCLSLRGIYTFLLIFARRSDSRVILTLDSRVTPSTLTLILATAVFVLAVSFSGDHG